MKANCNWPVGRCLQQVSLYITVRWRCGPQHTRTPQPQPHNHPPVHTSLVTLFPCSGLLSILSASFAAMTNENQCYLHATYEGVVFCQLILPYVVSGTVLDANSAVSMLLLLFLLLLLLLLPLLLFGNINLMLLCTKFSLSVCMYVYVHLLSINDVLCCRQCCTWTPCLLYSE